MLTRRFIISFSWVLILSLFSCQPRLAVQMVDQPVEFTILQINDVYEIAPLEGGKSAGLARVATLLKELEAENPNTIAVLAGDFLSPSLMGNLRMENGEKIAGLQIVETLNAMGLDYATFGNHEFDLKTSDLLQSRIDQSEFEYMTCNALLRKNGETSRFTQNGVEVPDYSVHTFVGPNEQLIKVAMVGVVLPFNQADYVAYLDVEESFKTAVEAAEASTDVVLGLTHLSIDGDMALAEAVPGLPLFMGGHEHHHLSRFVGSTAILKADANAKTVYVHRFTYYPKADVCRVHSELIPITDAIASEPKTDEVVQQWKAKVAGLIGEMGYNAERVVLDAQTTLQGTEAAVRSIQSNYGELTTKAFENAWPGADVYLFNGGSLRLDDDLSGTITEYDVLRSFPYGGPVVRMDMRGETLAELLTIGSTTNRGEGGYLQVLHAEFKNSEWQIQGQPLDKNKTYHVVLPKFMGQGYEANLGFLGDLTFEEKDHFPSDAGTPMRNDIRDMVITYMAKVKVWK